MFVSDNVKNTEAIKIGLSSMMNTVRGMHSGLLKQVFASNMGLFPTFRLCTRTNQILQKLLNQWLVADEIVNFFVFQLKGFEFLLDTIGTKGQNVLMKPKAKDEKEPLEQKKQDSEDNSMGKNLLGSDLFSLLSKQKPPKSVDDSKAEAQDDSPKLGVFEVPNGVEDEGDESPLDMKLEEFGKTMELIEETFENAPKNLKGTDWSMNKKCFKNKLMYKFYKEQDCFEHYMTFKLTTPAELREIQIGFCNFWPNDNEDYVEPLSVLVQAGMDLENLVNVCSLDAVTDHGYTANCSQVFGKNLRQFSSNEQVTDLSTPEAMRDTVERHLDSIYNFRCQYVKFSFRRNVVSCLENGLLGPKMAKRKTFAINYISVSGLNLNRYNSNMKSFVLKQQKKSALEVMSLICSGDFASVLKVIANQEATIEKMKENFDLLTTFVGQKQNIIEPTLIGISMHNEAMGNWIIQRFMNCENTTRFTDLIGKVIVCDPKRVSERLDVMLQRILSQLQEIKQDKTMQNKRIESVLPLIDIYIRCMHLVAHDLACEGSEEIDLKVECNVLMDIFQLLTSATEDRARQSDRLRKFIVTVLCPPEPFVNLSIHQLDFAQDVLLQPSKDIDQEIFSQMQLLAGSLACQNSKIALIIFEKRMQMEELFEKTVLGVARFWLNEAHDQEVRAMLQKEDLPIRLYMQMREEDPAAAGRIIKSDRSMEYNTLIVQLILNVSAGHQPSEKLLADTIIEDIKYLENNKDEFFIDNVLLPFIKNEQTLPVCLMQTQEPEQEGQHGWAPNFDLLTAEGSKQSNKVKITENASFVPSEIFDPNLRKTMLTAFREIVGKESKTKYEAAMTSKWNCVYTQTQPSQSTSEYPAFWEKIAEKGPVVFLCSGKVLNGTKKAVIGGYTSNSMPGVPANLNEEQEQDFPVSALPEDFVFMQVQDHGTYFMKPKVEDPIIIEMFTDYEGGGALSLAQDFLLLSFSYDFQFTAGTKEYLEEIKLESVPAQKVGLSDVDTSNFQLDKVEVWISNKGSKVKQAHGMDLKEKIHKSVCMLSESSKRHPWVNKASPYNLYRARPVYMVPSHLQMKQLAQIMLSRSISLTVPKCAALMHSQFSEQTVQEVYDQFNDDNDNAERQNKILDLGFSMVRLHTQAEEDGNQSTLAVDIVDQEDFAVRVSSLYKPKNGFFDQFEELGGVQKYISVTLATLKMWKNQKLANIWELWLKELQSFSEIPYYFQIFMKNKKCKELLFKILSGEPDKKTDEAKKWEDEQREAVQFNYRILSEAFSVADDVKIREVAVKADFLPRILERLGALSGDKPREIIEEKEEIEEEVEEVELVRKASYTKNTEKKKRKGVGYSANQGELFKIQEYLDNKKIRNEQIKTLVDICANFLHSKVWKANSDVLDDILESSLLPLLENAFRNGSFLDMAKDIDLYVSYFGLTRAIASQENLIHCLVEIDKRYKPVQTDAIHKLLSALNDLAAIFVNIHNQADSQNINENSSQEGPMALAKDVQRTHLVVQEAVEQLDLDQEGGQAIEDALSLPITEQYRLLLQGLRFDYMEITKHHYQATANQNKSPPSAKMVRLAQELADLSNALPTEHTNSVFVRVDKQRVDMMKAMLAGAIGTPYAHGLYEYDIFFDNAYPQGPPKMNLTTTGSGQIRFNPNLYSCGKVCLSLLGTWRGSATENWDAKISTTLQVLLSVQAIIMSEEVYFNEPGFENEAGTPEGEKKNEGYMNIVRYGNAKWAMLGHLKAPPPGFDTIIKRHFYIKRADILKDVYHWVTLADQNEASYQGLVSDHNHTLAAEFRKSKNTYKTMLTETVKELEERLNQLEKPHYEIKKQVQKKNKRKKQEEGDVMTGAQNLAEVDMGSDSEEEEGETGMIDTTGKKKKKKAVEKEMDIEDEAVKDRWSRYIGAMGIEAVAKQASAKIFLSGAGALGIEIAKNIVLAGCKQFTLHDTQPITQRDLSGQFFLSATDKQKSRSEACANRLQALNLYVRCKTAPSERLPLTPEDLDKEPWNFSQYDVVILTECDYETICAVNEYCHARGKKFMCADAVGVFGRLFNDFGDKFEVLDQNGEELQDVLIKKISCEEKGVVEILPTAKHKFQDGDEVHFTDITGMKLREGQKHEDPDCKSDSINDTIHKVEVITPYSFKVGDTTKYTEYEGNGIGKQLRMKLIMDFKPFGPTMLAGHETLPQDMNLSFADFEKPDNNILAHIAYEALDRFKRDKKAMPKAWDLVDATDFVALCKEISERYEMKPAEWKNDGVELKLLHLFAFQSQGVFNPLCAFFGGFVAQEIIKAITQKFSPTKQLFYYDCSEVLPDFDYEKHVVAGGDKDFFEKEYMTKMVKAREVGHRSDGLRICVGEALVNELAHCRLFMVGAGAIGCELLKNYAMCGVGVGKDTKDRKGGAIFVTDPDIIENSNLNRQFLFREKHLRKPKSQTAAAAAIHMNSDLAGNIIARLDKVHEGTANIYTDKFFEELTLVTNALDNVKARIYIDARCVTAKTPLLESGTLGPKGHVQVILPYKTESYGSMQDPEDVNEIPHCTLKMFPEETLHCIEWARDHFGKMFTIMPKSALKILEEGEKINPVAQQDVLALKEGLKLLRKRPLNFFQCVAYARLRFEKLYNHAIKQLIHVYPLDAKTKEGTAFWALPKRPPTPLVFDKEDKMHCAFISSLACLRAKMFFVEIPSETPRTEEFRKYCGDLASEFPVPDFVANEEKAKEIQNEVGKADKDKQEEKKTEDKEEPEEEVNQDDLAKQKEEFLNILKTLPLEKKKTAEYEDFLIRAEEFEKDDDSNFHIDFMYSMGNCRAFNYKLEAMDFVTVKLKAGRIVPALATTTACVAGLQTLELIKIVKDSKKVDFKNIFLNLAVPFMQAVEPADVIKEQLLEGVEVSLWDRWEMEGSEKTTLAEMINFVQEKFKGLEVRDILKGNMPVYLYAINNAAGKEKEREKLLSSTVHNATESYQEDLYVDLNIQCVRKDDEEQKILAGVPPLRVNFKKVEKEK